MAVRLYEGAIVEPTSHNDQSREGITEKIDQTRVLEFLNTVLKISMKNAILCLEILKHGFGLSFRLCPPDSDRCG